MSLSMRERLADECVGNLPERALRRKQDRKVAEQDEGKVKPPKLMVAPVKIQHVRRQRGTSTKPTLTAPLGDVARKVRR